MYGRHDYPWFHPDHQPREAFFASLHDEAGYIVAGQIAPLWVGEFSTNTRSLANFGLAAASRRVRRETPHGGATCRPG